MRALSSNSPTMTGRTRCFSNHCSSARRRVLLSPGRRNGAPSRPAGTRRRHLAAGHPTPPRGDSDAPAGAPDELLAGRALEHADLAAESRLREPQLLRGPIHRAFTRDHPEVQEVMVIESFHRLPSIHRLKRIVA